MTSPPEFPSEFRSDPSKRREFIEQHMMPQGIAPEQAQRLVDEANVMFEWCFLVQDLVEEMPDDQRRFHLHRIEKAAQELGRAVGVELSGRDRMAQLLSIFLSLSDDDDGEKAPVPEQPPVEKVLI